MACGAAESDLEREISDETAISRLGELMDERQSVLALDTCEVDCLLDYHLRRINQLLLRDILVAGRIVIVSQQRVDGRHHSPRTEQTRMQCTTCWRSCSSEVHCLYVDDAAAAVQDVWCPWIVH